MIIWFVVVESCDEILCLIFVLENFVFEVPVFHDESEMVTDLNFVGYFNSSVECVTHDSDEHIEKMQRHDKRSNAKQEVKNDFLSTMSKTKV